MAEKAPIPASPAAPVAARGKKIANRVKTPTCLQMEAVECGAASLSIILGYYKKFLPLEQLRVDCGVSRDGSKANNVLKAARKHGLEAKGFKHELETLPTLKMPVIVFWNFNHFLVLEGWKNGKVYLNNPAGGPQVVTDNDLAAGYTGVVLTFEPGKDFRPGGEPASLLPGLMRRLAGFKSALIYVFLCGLFLVIPGLVVPAFSRIFVDEYLVGSKADWVKPLLVGMTITAIISMVVTFLQKYFLLRFETKLALTTSAKFFTHVLRLPAEFFSQRFGGEIGSRVLINDKVAQVLSGQLTTTVLDMTMLGFFAVLMFQYDVVLTLTCIFLGGLNLVVNKWVARKRVDGSRRLLQESGKLMGTAMGGLQMIETLKATGGEGDFFARWAGYQAKALAAKQELGIYSQCIGALPPLLTSITTTAILGLGGMRVMNGHLTVGMLVAFQGLVGNFMKPITTFVTFGSTLQELEGDMNRLDDVLRYPQDEQYTRTVPADSPLNKLIKLTGHVEFRNVTFGYSPLEKPLIEDFSIVIKPGSRVALVGGSGSGKSTCAKLVSGLYKPWSGQILFDGVPREEIPHNLLCNSIGMVDQDIFLFGGTVRDNLAMWDSTIPEINITRAAKDAAIAEVIAARPGGFASDVEEGGSNFSGGQRQRLEIARALVGDPTFLILDEATSALDPTTEREIDDAMRRRGCSCLIVAHRLSTIRDADEIIVLERGKVVQRGTHDEMKAIPDSPYAHLIKE
ncbi:MAG TPA: NHLP family bacteriocin export ABC transporter peptidase/permease/ATPase subunit [Chthoniobacter sp.]|nr:NHLP family bacteriocin export ABC transporter peptidase/permease/ATPase subunit [Chthoniobacter sp.]